MLPKEVGPEDVKFLKIAHFEKSLEIKISMIWIKISMVILIASMLFKQVDIFVLDKKIFPIFSVRR